MELSLAHMSIRDATHAELIDIASGLHCDRVCIFIQGPHGLPSSFPCIDNEGSARELRKQLDDAGLGLGTLEAFVCRPDLDPAHYAKFLEIAGLLGAPRVTAINLHPDLDGAAAQLGKFCDMSAPYGVTVGLEWFRFSRTKTLPSALALLRRVDRPNLALTVDILHLLRNGGRPGDLAEVPPALMPYAQISDGPLEKPEERQEDEALSNRGFPGEGEFPLVAFVQSLPHDVVLSIEVPAERFRSSLRPQERAARAMSGTRKILAAATSELARRE